MAARPQTTEHLITYGRGKHLKFTRDTFEHRQALLTQVSRGYNSSGSVADICQNWASNDSSSETV